MAAVPTDFADLVGAPHFAHLVTVNADGSPQSSPIWIRPGRRDADGAIETVEFTTGLRYRKSLNMQREPRVSLSIHDADNPYRFLEIVGRAVLNPRTSWTQLDQISNTYLGTDYPWKGDSVDGWDVVVEIDRAYTHADTDDPPMRDKPEQGTDLLNPPHFAHIATVSSQGQPRSSVVWHRRTADSADGDDIEFWTGANVLKTRHLRRNPAVAVSIHDEADPYRYVELRGTADISPVDNHALLDELTPQYWTLDRYPVEETMPGVIIRVRTTHRVG